MACFNLNKVSVLILVTALVVAILLPVILVHSLSLEGIETGKYEQALKAEVEKVKAARIKMGLLEGAVKEVMFSNPTDLQIAWYNFAKKEESFNGIFPSVLQLKEENERLEHALKSKVIYYIALPIAGVVILILSVMTANAFRRARAEKAFSDKKSSVIGREKLKLISELSSDSQEKLSELMFSMLNCYDALLGVLKSGISDSARLKGLKRLHESVLFDMYGAGILQTPVIQSEHDALVQGLELWKDETRRDCREHIQDKDAEVQAKMEQLDVLKAEVEQQIEKGVQRHILSETGEIAKLTKELESLQGKVTEWSTWEKQQTEEKEFLEMRKAELEEQEVQLGSRELALASRESAVQSQKRS